MIHLCWVQPFVKCFYSCSRCLRHTLHSFCAPLPLSAESEHAQMKLNYSRANNGLLSRYQRLIWVIPCAGQVDFRGGCRMCRIITEQMLAKNSTKWMILRISCNLFEGSNILIVCTKVGFIMQSTWNRRSWDKRAYRGKQVSSHFLYTNAKSKKVTVRSVIKMNEITLWTCIRFIQAGCQYISRLKKLKSNTVPRVNVNEIFVAADGSIKSYSWVRWRILGWNCEQLQFKLQKKEKWSVLIRLCADR